MLNKVKHKHRGFIHSEEYASMNKYEKFIHDKVFNSHSKDFIQFLFTIKDKSRKLTKKLYHKYKHKNFISFNKFINDPLLL